MAAGARQVADGNAELADQAGTLTAGIAGIADAGSTTARSKSPTAPSNSPRRSTTAGTRCPATPTRNALAVRLAIGSLATVLVTDRRRYLSARQLRGGQLGPATV